MRLLITEVTEMSHGNYCVAGWDQKNGRMMRPLPDGNNWTSQQLTEFALTPGAFLDVALSQVSHSSSYPHRTEDTPIAQITRVDSNPFDWRSSVCPPISADVQSAFDGKVSHNSEWNGIYQGVYVLVGTQVNSLVALSLPRTSLTFIEEFSKLKVILNDGAACYKLPVSSAALKSAWRRGGVDEVIASLPQAQRFHIRIGLARAFDDAPQQCYMMLNGVQ